MEMLYEFVGTSFNTTPSLKACLWSNLVRNWQIKKKILFRFISKWI